MTLIQQFGMRKGLKAFGRETGMKSMTKEIHVQQLHQRNSFKPINVRSMTDEEKARLQDAIMLLVQKDSENEVKSRLVYNGKETRKWLSREEIAGPIVSLESIHLTFAMYAYYLAVINHSLHHLHVRKRSSSSCYMIEKYNTHQPFPCYWTMNSHFLNYATLIFFSLHSYKSLC